MAAIDWRVRRIVSPGRNVDVVRQSHTRVLHEQFFICFQGPGPRAEGGSCEGIYAHSPGRGMICKEGLASMRRSRRQDEHAPTCSE